MRDLTNKDCMMGLALGLSLAIGCVAAAFLIAGDPRHDGFFAGALILAPIVGIGGFLAGVVVSIRRRRSSDGDSTR